MTIEVTPRKLELLIRGLEARNILLDEFEGTFAEIITKEKHLKFERHRKENRALLRELKSYKEKGKNV